MSFHSFKRRLLEEKSYFNTSRIYFLFFVKINFSKSETFQKFISIFPFSFHLPNVFPSCEKTVNQRDELIRFIFLVITVNEKRHNGKSRSPGILSRMRRTLKQTTWRHLTIQWTPFKNWFLLKYPTMYTVNIKLVIIYENIYLHEYLFT